MINLDKYYASGAPNKRLEPGQLAWVRHPTFGYPNVLCRITTPHLTDKHDIEYNWLNLDGEECHCYSSWLEPVNPIEAIALEVYGKTPPYDRDAS